MSSGSDSDTTLPNVVLMPRWPVCTTLMPQPATLTISSAMTTIAPHITIRPSGSLNPPLSELPPPGPRKIGAVNAMLFAPSVGSTTPQARAPVGRQQRDRPQQRHAQARMPALCAPRLGLARIQVTRRGRQREHD